MVAENWIESLRGWMEKKSAILYKVYAVSFILTNWKTFYILLISSSNQGSVRIFEAQQEFVSRKIFSFNWSEYYIVQFLLPAFVTYLVIVHLPKLNNKVYRLYLSEDQTRRLAKAESDLEVANAVKLNKSEELESYQTAEELQVQIDSLMSQIKELQGSSSEEDSWLQEYLNTQNISGLMSSLEATVYEHGGEISTFDVYGDLLRKNITSAELSKADSLNLIEIIENKSIVLTLKGKAFLRFFHRTPTTNKALIS